MCTCGSPSIALRGDASSFGHGVPSCGMAGGKSSSSAWCSARSSAVSAPRATSSAVGPPATPRREDASAERTPGVALPDPRGDGFVDFVSGAVGFFGTAVASCGAEGLGAADVAEGATRSGPEVTAGFAAVCGGGSDGRGTFTAADAEPAGAMGSASAFVAQTSTAYTSEAAAQRDRDTKRDRQVIGVRASHFAEWRSNYGAAPVTTLWWSRHAHSDPHDQLSRIPWRSERTLRGDRSAQPRA